MSSASRRQVHTQTDGHTKLIKFGILTLLVGLIAVLIQRQTQTASPTVSGTSSVPNNDAVSLKRYKIIDTKLEEITWPKNAEDVTRLLTRLHNPGPEQKPILIKQAPVHEWAAFSKWNPQYFVEKFGQKKLTFKMKTTDPVFVYHEQKPLDSTVSQIKKRTQEKKKLLKFEKLTMAQFWEKALAENQTKSHIYFSETISSSPESTELEASILIDDIAPPNILIPETNHFINLWLGSPGVVAQTHYDQDPNFAIQILGHKRWILSPPSEALKLAPYPYLHSSFRQSMLNFTSETLIDAFMESDPVSAQALKSVLGETLPTPSAYEVVAGPGNVLYIPPLWFHRVVTEDTNMWTDRTDGDPLALASKIPIPVENSWSEIERCDALRYLAQEIALLIPQGPMPTELNSGMEHKHSIFAFDLLRLQYRLLFRNAKPKNRLCSHTPDHQFLDLLRSKSTSSDYANRVATALSRAQDPASIHILFAAYIEMMIDVLLGAKKAHGFVLGCLP